MSPSKRITHRLSVVMALFGVCAVAAGFIIGMTGWPPALATASAEPLPVSSDATLSLATATDTTTATLAAIESSETSSLTFAAVADPRSLSFGVVPAHTMAKKKMLRAVPKPKHGAKRSAWRAKRHAHTAVRRLRVGRWNSARVSWYGPGFYGHTMAGGGRLTRASLIVAHRSLPFGTKVQISYKGRSVIAVVRDRGPYVSGRTFDLGPGTAKRLGFSGVGRIKYRIVR